MAKFIGAVPNFFKLIKKRRRIVMDDKKRIVSIRTMLMVFSSDKYASPRRLRCSAVRVNPLESLPQTLPTEVPAGFMENTRTGQGLFKYTL